MISLRCLRSVCETRVQFIINNGLDQTIMSLTQCQQTRGMAGHSHWHNIRHIKEAKDSIKHQTAMDVVRKLKLAALGIYSHQFYTYELFLHFNNQSKMI